MRQTVLVLVLIILVLLGFRLSNKRYAQKLRTEGTERPGEALLGPKSPVSSGSTVESFDA